MIIQRIWYVKCVLTDMIPLLSLVSDIFLFPSMQDESDKESTKQAISSIFFPEQPIDLDSILLKRGPILVGGQDERELMLFTNGFVLSRIELDTLVELLFDVNSSAEELTSDQLCERFRLIDTDGSGCKCVNRSLNLKYLFVSCPDCLNWCCQTYISPQL